MLSFESSLKSFTDICEVSCTAHQMFICVKITEKATGRVITYCGPDDIYYPFETQSGQISSVGYAEVCAVADEEAVRKAGVAPQSRDAVLDIQQLCGIYSSVGCGKAVLGALLKDLNSIPSAMSSDLYLKITTFRKRGNQNAAYQCA